MAFLSNFDANTVERLSFEPIPEGPYLAAITKSEFKATKNGMGKYLELVFQVLDGQHKGRQVWSRLNLDNQNSTAVQIARTQLADICLAVGNPKPKDSVELHNIPMIITVKCKKRDDSADITNEISAYLPRGPQKATAEPQAAPKDAAAVTDGEQPVKSPWSR